jgi:hypothetical protein
MTLGHLGLERRLDPPGLALGLGAVVLEALLAGQRIEAGVDLDLPLDLDLPVAAAVPDHLACLPEQLNRAGCASVCARKQARQANEGSDWREEPLVAEADGHPYEPWCRVAEHLGHLAGVGTRELTALPVAACG